MAEGASLKIGDLEYGAIELDSVAAEIAIDVHDRAAEAAALTIGWLRDDGRALNEMQEIRLIATVIRCFDGTERGIHETLARSAASERIVRLVEDGDDA